MSQRCQLKDAKSKTATPKSKKQPKTEAAQQKRTAKKRTGKAFDALATRIVTMRESTSA